MATHHTWRLARSVLIAAALGLATSVLLAWAISLWPPRAYGNLAITQTPAPTPGPPPWRAFGIKVHGGGLGLMTTTLFVPVPGEALTEEACTRALKEMTETAAREHSPSQHLKQFAKYGESIYSLARLTGTASLEFRSVGWPRLCLQSKTRAAIGGATSASWGVHISLPFGGPPRFTGPLNAVLPVYPLWQGCAVNTLIFGAPGWLALFGTQAWRTRRWRVRGCCTRCGYDLKSDYAKGCPECGWNRPNNPPA